MLKSYIKIAWRNLFRNKGFSLTNLLGLTMGMTCAMLILLWVKDEITYDRFQSNYDNIYQVLANRDFKNQVFTDPNMVFPLAKSLEKGYPQIKNAVVTSQNETHVFAYGETKLKKTSHTVSEGFFDMFSWKFIKGSPASAIKEPNSLVLTRSAATSLFGKADPINKVVKIDDDRNLKITAVLEDVPANSSIQFDCIMPYDYSDPSVKRNLDEWYNSSSIVYVETIKGADLSLLDKNINALIRGHAPNDHVSTYFSFPMSKWRLESEFKEGKNVGGMIEYVRLFTIIALMILLIACVNFMNLSTARSEKRSREVGIRKTLGSFKRQLIFQFLVESMILVCIAFVLSVISVILILPSFNLLVSKQLALNFSEPAFWMGAAGIILFTGFTSGSYPALYLSSFNPVKVLKGTFLAGKKAVLPRRVLVVGQFVISILLISATIIIYQQIQHVKSRHLGYKPDNLVTVPMSDATRKNFTVIREELLKTGMISSITRTSSPITEVWWKSPSPEWQGKPEGTNIIFSGLRADVDFAKTMGIHMVAGKDFSGTPSDSSSMLLNKTAVDAMGLKNPIGMEMRYGGRNFTVIGVTDNIVMESPFKPVDPLMVYYNNNAGALNMISMRLNDGTGPQKAILAMQKIFDAYNPAFPFEYKFVDQEFGTKFITEEMIGKLTNIFAGLAIFICCLGLAGLASFTIEKRFREIGIRKVLGASVQQLLMLISREFVRLVLIAFIIATPCVFLLMNNWLDKYPDHISVNIWLIALVGLAIGLLTLTIVSLNTLKAAMSNPVKSLRTE